MSRFDKKTKRKKGGRARGALVLISALLIGSAVLRLGQSAGQAMALTPSDRGGSELEAEPAEMSAKSLEELRPLLEAFHAREARIAEKEVAIQKRMQVLRAADEKLEKKLSALIEAETKLRETIALAQSAAEGDLTRLTKVYETMKPKQAAALFEEMAPEFAAGFLGRMRPDAAAAIMAGLSPDVAHQFSVVLAGRNAEVPRE